MIPRRFLLLFLLALPCLGADPPLSLERGAHLERFPGDLAAAEAVYREVLARGASGDLRAEALFRLGGVLARRDREEAREVFGSLREEFPARRDLAARAETALAGLAAPGAAAGEAAGSRGEVLARRPDGVFAFGVGPGHGLETGRRCTVYREGRIVGVGLVLRAGERLVAAKLASGEVAPGDRLDPGPSAAPGEGGPAAEPGRGARAEEARRFLDTIALVEGPEPGGPPAPVPAAAPPPAGAPAVPIRLEVRAVICSAVFAAALPLAFEHCLEPSPLPDAFPTDGPALLALAGPAEGRAVLERVRAAGKAAPGGEGEAFLYRAERVDLVLGRRHALAFGVERAPAPGAAAPSGGFEGFRLGLRAIEPRLLPGGGGIDFVDIEVEAVAIDLCDGPSAFPALSRPIAITPPIFQRIRPVVRLTRSRPVAFLAGLRDPLRPAEPRPRGARPARAERQGGDARHPERRWAPPPRCAACGALERPGVVWFGEALPAPVLEAAFEAARTCDLALVAGTSAVVYPAARVARLAIERGADAIEVNPEPTGLSSLVTVSVRGRSGEVLPAIVSG